MRKILIISLLIITTFSLSAKKHAKSKQNKPISVIFDTDLGNDIDDVMALNMLINYQKSHKVQLLGITISKSNPYTVEYIDGFCRFNHLENIPIGYAYNGVNPDAGKYLKQTLDTIIDGKKILMPKLSIKDNLLEGYKLQRKLLAAQQDKSVIMIAVGPETNIANLLNSKSDEFSPLSGVELVKQKVKLLSVMGGLYDDSYNFSEWNIVQDLVASQTVFSKWPTPIVASGYEIGNKLLYPHQSILNDFKDGYKNPMCVSYKIYEKMPYDRQTWDLTSVLYAIEPALNLFDLSEKGKITISQTGKSEFNRDENGNHQYLKIDKNQYSDIVKALVNRVVGK